MEERDTTSDTTLKDVELMDGPAHLNVNVPGGNGFKVLIRWNCFGHDRVGAKRFSNPGRQANHPMEPEKSWLMLRLRSSGSWWGADWNVIGIEDRLARGWRSRSSK